MCQVTCWRLFARLHALSSGPLSQTQPTTPGPCGQHFIQERIWQSLEYRGLPNWFRVLGKQCPVPAVFLDGTNSAKLRLVRNWDTDLAALESESGDTMNLSLVFQDPVHGASADEVPASDVEAAVWFLLDSCSG